MNNNAVLNNLLDAANRAAHLSGDDSDFDSIVSQTRRSFRRSTGHSRSTTSGRKKCTFIKKNLLLFRRSNVDFYPASKEVKYLTEMGLGKREKVEFKRSWAISEIEQYIYQQYIDVPLELIGFKFAKCSTNRKITLLGSVDSVDDIIKETKQGALLIIPNRDIPIVEVQRRAMERERSVSEQIPPITSVPGSSTNVVPVEVERNQTTRRRLTENQTDEENQTINLDSNDVDADTVYVPNDFGLNDNQIDTLDVNFVVPTMPDSAEIFNITLSRSDTSNTLFQLYRDETFNTKKLSVDFIGELGVDAGGLTKEMFNLFFSELESRFFRGEDCLVPFLPLNRIRKEKENFVLIGRAIEHMLLLTGNMPSKLSRIVLSQIGNPDFISDTNILLEDFLEYVNPCERAVIKKSLESFDAINKKEKEILINIFHSNQFYELPCSSDVKDQIVAIASDIFYDKSKQFIDFIRKGICLEKYKEFWQYCNFNILLEIQKPSIEKVVNCLRTQDDLNNEQTTVYHFLEMYIRCLDNDTLRQFVMFVTGSYQMPEFITVVFNCLTGLSRRPIVSTCANIIELSSMYCTYQDFKKDLNACLISEEAYSYSNF